MEKFISIKNWLSESFLTVDGKKLPVIFVKKEDWPEGKNDPTEYSTDENAVRIRKGDYDTEKDPMGWLRHELMHYLLDQKGFKDDEKEYPHNAVERKAYEYQFKYLKKLGYKNIEDVPGMGKDSYIEILKKYWKNA